MHSAFQNETFTPFPSRSNPPYSNKIAQYENDSMTQFITFKETMSHVSINEIVPKNLVSNSMFDFAALPLRRLVK